MLVVGIDVSAEKGVVFLGEGGKVLVKKVIHPYTSSEKLLPLLDALLKERELEPESLKGIIVSLGPGSFTGLRIGVCLAKALAFVLKIPLIGVSAFDSWVFSSSAQGILCPLKKAHSSRLYGAFYRKDKEMRRLSEYLFLPFKKILKMSKEFSPQRVSFLISHESSFDEPENSLSTSLERIIPEEALLKFGIYRLNKEESDDISSLTPLYVAPPKIGLAKMKKKEGEIDVLQGALIRSMRKGDILQVSQIEKLSFPTPWSCGIFSSELDKKNVTFYYVMEYQDKVIAYIGYWKLANEAHLVNLAVYPAFRKKGLGSKLLKYILEKAQSQGLDTITLEVRRLNLAAQKFYERFDFKKIAICSGYYVETGEDALVYWKKI